MTVTKGMPKAQVELAGKRYDLRFDIESIAEVEVTAQALSLNAGRSSYYDLLDAPYNMREQLVLLLVGINGAKRFDGMKDMLNQQTAKTLLGEHFEWIRSRKMGIPEWQESIKKLNTQLSEAARLGVGLVPPSMMEEEKSAKV